MSTSKRTDGGRNLIYSLFHYRHFCRSKNQKISQIFMSKTRSKNEKKERSNLYVDTKKSAHKEG